MNVQELLESKQIHFIPKGKDFVVRCLNPEHEDRNPSMRIDQIDGRFNCFSCEFKGNLFTHFGEAATGLQLRREVIKRKIQEKRAENRINTDSGSFWKDSGFPRQTYCWRYT